MYWPTAEHFFQAAKFADEKYRERVRRAATPKDARALGQSRSLPLRADWNHIREEVILRALRLKFRACDAREVLLCTGARPLIENSPFDHYWGAGKDGSGLNKLDALLEQVRTELLAHLSKNQ